MKVLLTSPRAPATLELARAFADQGHDVHVCDSLRFSCGSLSKHTRSHFIAGPRLAPRLYAEQLRDLIEKLQIDLLLPTCEEIFYIARFRHMFGCQVLADDFDLLQRLHNKWSFSQLGSNEFGRVPDTKLFESRDDLKSVEDQSSEYVFKPVYSRFASETLICPTRDQIRKIHFSAGRYWVAQKYIGGQEYSTYSIAQSGELLAHVSYRSLYRAGLGSGIYFESTVNEAIESYVKTLARELNLTGQIGFDCIIDKQGQLWVIEANPRATSGVHLFDHAETLVNAILNQPENSMIQQSCGTPRMLGPAVAIWGVAQALSQLKPADFVKNLARAKDVLFKVNDPIPMIALPLTVAEIAIKALRNFQSLQQASTQDIEWNGQSI